MKNIIRSLSLMLLLLGFSTSLFAQKTEAERVKHFNLSDQLAIQGYDPVAYFTQQKAAKGKPSLSTQYQGVVYHFATEQNRKMFLANPSRFEPQYGGWCAFAMGDYGKKVKINPETFKIVDDKLYLFYNAFFTNTLKDWNKDEANLKTKGDRNWANLTK